MQAISIFFFTEFKPGKWTKCMWFKRKNDVISKVKTSQQIKKVIYTLSFIINYLI